MRTLVTLALGVAIGITVAVVLGARDQVEPAQPPPIVPEVG